MPPTAVSQIRNFSIIAHVDHGKTTLTDALLQLTNTVTPLEFHERMLDSNPIEQEKGVTIKLAPVRMEHQGYILNLIDTPGHVDFSYEVSRSLAACEGAILLIDATQGGQAQTLTHYQKAKQLGLTIIPVINKIDLASANVEQTSLEIMELFGLDDQAILQVSAKTGQGVPAVLQAILDKIPPPPAQKQPNHTQALIITSKFDSHQGIIAYVRVVQGQLNKEALHLMASQVDFKPLELGVFTPTPQAKNTLNIGEVGYIATGLKDISQLKVGDTVTRVVDKKQVKALPGYREPQAMVYMELYPLDTKNFSQLKQAMAKLTLNDSALQYQATHSIALGNGLRVGFLGIFHAAIVRERLAREFNLDLIATAPSINYQIQLKNGQQLIINNPAELPDPSSIEQLAEAICQLTILTPAQYVAVIIKLCQTRRATLKNSGGQQRLDFTIPLAELISDFHDQLKSATSGFASMEYQFSHYQAVTAVKIDILINYEKIDALSFISVEDQALTKARQLVSKLKQVVPRQLFEVPIQAAIGGKIVARETISAFRKDVTAKLYGGDRTRRMKLLKKQSQGKKKLKQVGKVQLNQEAFLAVLEN